MKMHESTSKYVKIIMEYIEKDKICFDIVQTVNLMKFVQMNNVKQKR